MRMTNKIMRNNSAYNLNQNKILTDKLTNQMTTQSKIARPSDDPVVAIRALRLRSNVTAATQYNDRNAKDADQWLTVTADAMNTVDKVLDSLYKQATSAPDKFEIGRASCRERVCLYVYEGDEGASHILQY